MIDQRMLRGLEGLTFAPRRAMEGQWNGLHASPQRGTGQEFHDYRAYVSGDPVSDVDWKLFGRTDRWYVRRHRALTDLHAYVFVDASASMDFAGVGKGGGEGKWQYACNLAAAIGWMTIRQSDRAGLGIFSDKVIEHLPPGGTWRQFKRMAAAMERAKPGAAEGNIAAALKQAGGMLSRRGVFILISDGLDEPAEIFSGLGQLVHRQLDVIFLQVLHREELGLEGLGGFRGKFTDAETGAVLTTSVEEIQKRYAQVFGEHLEAIWKGCAMRGIDHQVMMTDQPVAESLKGFLFRRSAVV